MYFEKDKVYKIVHPKLFDEYNEESFIPNRNYIICSPIEDCVSYDEDIPLKCHFIISFDDMIKVKKACTHFYYSDTYLDKLNNDDLERLKNLLYGTSLKYNRKTNKIVKLNDVKERLL